MVVGLKVNFSKCHLTSFGVDVETLEEFLHMLNCRFLNFPFFFFFFLILICLMVLIQEWRQGGSSSYKRW